MVQETGAEFGNFDQEPQVPESQAAGDDRLGVRAELERSGKKNLSMREIFAIIRDRVIDISPDFLVSEDRIIRDFQESNRQSVDLSKSTGALFDYLARYALRKPDKGYAFVPRESVLARIKDEEEAVLKSGLVELRVAHIPKSIRLQAGRELVRLGHRELPPVYQEKKEDNGNVTQNFLQKIKQEGGANLLEEVVGNTLKNDSSLTASHLYVHNILADKTLELEQLLPPGYVFRPASMFEIKTEYVASDGEGHIQEKITQVPKDLKDYKGCQTLHGGFSESSGNKHVRYGDLSKRGGMLGLLHETAHAWHSQYREGHARSDFEKFLSEIKFNLMMVDVYSRGLEVAQDSEVIELIQQPLREAVGKLENIGVEIIPETESHKDIPSQPGSYRIPKLQGDHFLIKNDRLEPLLVEFVRQERDAWAHAIRVLRYLRRQGFDLEPQLRTLQDVQEEVHVALRSYQTYIEGMLEIPKDIKGFTKKEG